MNDFMKYSLEQLEELEKAYETICAITGFDDADDERLYEIKQAIDAKSEEINTEVKQTK